MTNSGGLCPISVVLILLSYREVPSFGRDTIRRFSGNTSAVKRLAARDFEDLLQVCYNSSPHVMVMQFISDSVLFPYSMGFFQNRTMGRFADSYSPWHIGMP
jgi:hypothetical protein